MPATYILATEDTSLLEAWIAQLPTGRPFMALGDITSSYRLPPGVPVVVVLDALLSDRLPSALEKCPLVAVGQPNTVAFEQWRITGRARQVLDYKESRARLREILPLIEELAERNCALDLLIERTRRAEGLRVTAPRPASMAETPEFWDFLEGAVENLASRERLLGEFRRASRFLLRASHTVFFLREESGFRADRGTSFCPVDEPLVAYLSAHPVVLDGIEWPGPSDPIAELAVRNRLALWGARLLVPLHEQGQLLGMIACGVRDDGQGYDDADKARAVFVARLLRQFLGQGAHLGRLLARENRLRIAERYLPETLILAEDEEAPRSVPVAVRALIGEARRTRDTRRLSPTTGQPFRASAGLVAETGGVWAVWEEASAEVFDRASQTRRDRLASLRDLALTLNHEIGNALVSLNALRYAQADGRVAPASLQATAGADLHRLDDLNRSLGRLAAFAEARAEPADLRELLRAVGERHGVAVEVGPEPVMITVVPSLVDHGLDAIVRAVAENRPQLGTKELTLQLRSTGADEELTALISIKGRQLELEGILPANDAESVPNQGRLGVFIAKEVIRLHRGDIHAGPGMEGTEILISLRKW